MSTILNLLRGQMSSPVNHLEGRCPHIPFFTGGQMSEGGNVRLPKMRDDQIPNACKYTGSVTIKTSCLYEIEPV